MKRAYLHGILDLNAGKLNALNALFAPFRDALKKTMAYWHVRLQQGADLPLYVALPDKTSVGGLSARQMKSVGNMVRTQLLSWQALLELRVRHLVTDSSLTDDDKLVLLRVNKWHAWWKPEFQLPWKPDKDGVLVPCGMKVRNKVMVDVEPRLLKLARLLVKQATKSNRFPDMGRVNTLVLDRIVAKPERPDNTDHPRVSWWVKTSTLTKGKPVEVGLLANTHFEHAYEDAVARGGGMCGVVQLHRVKGTKDFSMSLVLDIPDSAQRDTGRTVGLDFGMADALLATSDGHLFGRKMLERLRVLDEQLIEHDQWLAKRSLKRKGDREHERLNRRIRETVKNEVGRIINQLALKHDPEQVKTLVVERLDFRGGGMSKRMNRLITRTGRAALKRKLEAIQETAGITVEQVPAQYTSQECSGCGYTDKKNRASRARFTCRFCGKTMHADINAARVIQSRRSWQHPDNTGLKARKNTRQLLDWRFRQRWNQPIDGAVPDVTGAPGGQRPAPANGKLAGTSKYHDLVQN